MKASALLSEAIKHHQAGRLAEAAALYREILAGDPVCADALHLLGVIAHQTGDHAKAVEMIRQAATRAPRNAAVHCNLGEAYRLLGRLGEAVACFETALTLQPDYPTALNNLGNALHTLGRHDEARQRYERASVLEPNDPSIPNNLGNLFKDLQDYDRAVACFQRALALRPNFAEARHNLGVVLKAQGRLDEAVAAFQEAIAQRPDIAEFHNSLASACKDLGQIEAALVSYRQALSLAPQRADIHSNLILALHYRSAETDAIETELRRWNSAYVRPLASSMRAHANDRSPERRLKVGYVSPDFRLHPVAFFLLPLLQAHDGGKFHVTAFSNGVHADDITVQIRSCVAEWRSLVGVNDDDAARIVREAGIDILVDLAGHTAKNRLTLFARKPAPVQVSFLGFPGKTGVDTIDYRLTDRWADPFDRNSESGCEQLVRLADAAWCFAPLSGSPPLTDPPAVRRGYVTFGCFNNFAKVTEEMLELWVGILRRVPRSRLMLKGPAVASASAADHVRQFFVRREIAPERLLLRDRTASALDHLRCYEEIDIALDTFPYHGTTTTCEALWMGVPVITRAGSTHAGRVGVSLLTQVGRAEFIAESGDAYVAKAVAIGSDLLVLRQMRATLRDQFRQSPLMDGPRYARAVEAAYRHMWRRWCAAAGTS